MISAPEPDAPKQTVLVIEDEDPVRYLMALALERTGFRVLQAGGFDEAISIWQKEHSTIGLVISDILLPGTSGPEIARVFRARRPDIKIIFASGNNRESVVETSQMVKGSKFLLKPFSMSELVTVVRSTLAEMSG